MGIHFDFRFYIDNMSLPAIKKYIAANYKVDIVKLNRFVNKALKGMTEKGVLTKVKGSYKISAKTKEEKPKKAVKAKKAKSPKKKAAAKKPAGEKKAKSPKKKAAAKPKKAKTPKKPAAKKP